MLLDKAIIKQYLRLDIPVDQILSDPETARQFHQAVNDQIPGDSQVDLFTLNRRLLNLRKRGADKGGLPRLRRSYRGRSA